MVPEQEAQLLKSYLGQIPVRRRQGGGCVASLLKLLAVGIFSLAALYLLAPWAFHIGGRWTPLLTWHGYGKLQTKDGVAYPLYVSFFPASYFSQLHREGLRPTGGLQGSGWLCTAPGVTQPLQLSGTIYGGWRTTEGSFMAFRLVEPKIIDVGQGSGFFDLAGRWQGSKLVMDDHEHVLHTFRSGLRIEQASVTLDWGTYSDFRDLCARAAK